MGFTGFFHPYFSGVMGVCKHGHVNGLSVDVWMGEDALAQHLELRKELERHGTVGN